MGCLRHGTTNRIWPLFQRVSLWDSAIVLYSLEVEVSKLIFIFLNINLVVLLTIFSRISFRLGEPLANTILCAESL